MIDLGHLADKISTAQAEPSDYLNEEENLTYCGKCHTPKQMRWNNPVLDELTTVPIPCRCLSEKYQEEDRAEQERKHREIVKKLSDRGLRDRKILEWVFANDDGSSPNIAKAKRYVEQFDRAKEENIGLLFWGDVGTGKSFVAGCIANALIEKEISVCMTNFGIILADVMNLKADRNEYIKKLNQNTLLIIDDFGMERDTPFALEQVYNVVDSRYTSNKPLIVTTNLTLPEVQNRGVQSDLRRIYDRILEMCVPILFEGESKRKNKAEEKRNKLREMLG